MNSYDFSQLEKFKSELSKNENYIKYETYMTRSEICSRNTSYILKKEYNYFLGDGKLGKGKTVKFINSTFDINDELKSDMFNDKARFDVKINYVFPNVQ